VVSRPLWSQEKSIFHGVWNCCIWLSATVQDSSTLQLQAVMNWDKTMHNEQPWVDLISHSILISIGSDLLGGPSPSPFLARSKSSSPSVYSCSRPQIWCNSVRSSESAVCSGGGAGDSRLVCEGAGADALEVCCEHAEGRERKGGAERVQAVGMWILMLCQATTERDRETGLVHVVRSSWYITREFIKDSVVHMLW